MNQPPAFLRQWDEDPYAVKRAAALSWLGERYLLARPVPKKLETQTNRKLENEEQ